MHSTQVTRMVKGYSNHATDLGYGKKEQCLTEAQMHTLLESMHRSGSSNIGCCAVCGGSHASEDTMQML